MENLNALERPWKVKKKESGWMQWNLKLVVRSSIWRSPPPSCEGRFVGFFFSPFLCGIKTQMRRLILFHLFKWRRVRLGWERDSFVRKKPVTKHWERNVRKNHCDFRTPTRKCFSDCNCGFIHRWIELIFGKHVLHMWYFQLFGWITENLFGEEDK